MIHMIRSNLQPRNNMIQTTSINGHVQTYTYDNESFWRKLIFTKKLTTICPTLEKVNKDFKEKIAGILHSKLFTSIKVVLILLPTMFMKY